MTAKKTIFTITVFILAIFLSGCLTKTKKPKDPRMLENGYKLPIANEENVNKLIQQTMKNLVFVKGGSFMMGEIGYIENGERYYWGYSDNFPAHKITLDSYSILKHEVTYWEYDVYSDLIDKKPVGLSFQHQNIRRDNYPVGEITWQEANDYCLWLGKKTGLPFSLPTEAQWEYAARSRGQNVGFATDNGKMEDGRNHRKSGSKTKIYPIGTFPPNPLGLYDMSGNIGEWVWDWYDKNYYKKSLELNPKGPQTGTEKIIRGGRPTNSPSGNNVYSRDKNNVIFAENDTTSLRTSYYFGFRCVVNSPDQIKVNNDK